jgi:hypothetical protein
MKGTQEAKEVVEKYLGLGDFIECNKHDIFKKIEIYDHDPQNGMSCETSFTSDSLLFISFMMHAGCVTEKFNHSRKWVSNVFPGEDPLSVLSAIIFLYIVEQGWNQFSNSTDKTDAGEEKRIVWERILERTKNWIHQS